MFPKKDEETCVSVPDCTHMRMVHGYRRMAPGSSLT